jgi:hypothetical protein
MRASHSSYSQEKGFHVKRIASLIHPLHSDSNMILVVVDHKQILFIIIPMIAAASANA